MEDRCKPLTLSATRGRLYTAMELLVLKELEAQMVEVMPEEEGVEIDCPNMRVNSQSRVCVQWSMQIRGCFEQHDGRLVSAGMAKFGKVQMKLT